jgi:transglutaminase-like putative cysteine protease
MKRSFKSIAERFTIYIPVLLIVLSSCSGGGHADGEEERGDGKAEREEASVEEKEAGSGERTSKEQVEAGIRDHIDKKTESGGGHFRIETDSQELALKLVRVHTEFIANLAPERHFVCVDLASESGNVYDVDFFMEGTPGDFEVTQTTLHKKNGRPFYTWAQKDDGTWHRVPIENASRKTMGVIQGRDSFEFHYEVELPEIEGDAEFWMPVLQSGRFQDVELSSMDLPSDKKIFEEKDYGNRILHMNLGPEHGGERIEAVYQVEREEKGPYQDPGSDPQEYLSASSLLPVGGRFKRMAERALEGKSKENRLMKARALYDMVIDTMAYQKAGKYGTGDARYACDSQSGNCTEFHSLFISLARSVGIPARFAIGASIPSERNEGGLSGYHCWAEFYAQDKWWPIDISEANKYEALRAYYFGHHPANRIELSRGRGLDPEPGPSSGPIDFFAFPVLEVEGERKPVEANFSFKRGELS